jgi:hypothetical protein
MAHLVTLAHRVSAIHARYSKIRGAVFAFSLGRIISLRRKGKTPGYCVYEKRLTALHKELAEVEAAIRGPVRLEPSTTFGVEFAAILSKYVVTLSETIERLGRICGRSCRDNTGGERYDEALLRRDRVAYAESLQSYRRLGRRLNQLFRQF